MSEHWYGTPHVCQVCYALVPEARMTDHRRWHQTLTNLPAATLTGGQSLAGEGGPDATP